MRLGIIGFNEGNGHPYSWSAIFNGYEPAAMEECGFPVIPNYLAEHRFPEESIANATVTHVWTPNPDRTEHIAAASLIPHVADKPEQLIREVDAVLIARDDVESPERSELIELFLEAGLPMFVDKPLALSRKVAEGLLMQQHHPWQLFSASALGFAPELLQLRDEKGIGEIRYLEGVAPKSWQRYAVHAIEPALALLGTQGEIVHSSVSSSEHSHVVTIRWKSGLQASFTTLLQTPTRVGLKLYGEEGQREIRFLDTFRAFRSGLEAFIWQVRHKQPHPSQARLLDVIDVIEAGLSSNK